MNWYKKAQSKSKSVEKTIFLPDAINGGYVKKPKSYLRFGELPFGKAPSKNWGTMENEAGISTFEGWYDPETKIFVLETGGEELINTFNNMFEKRKLLLLDGEEVNGVGGDYETLLDPNTVQILREISLDEVVTVSDRDVTLSGLSLVGENIPDWDGLRVVSPPNQKPVLKEEVVESLNRIIPLDQVKKPENLENK